MEETSKDSYLLQNSVLDTLPTDAGVWGDSPDAVGFVGTFLLHSIAD